MPRKYSFERRKQEQRLELVARQLRRVQWKYSNSILLLASALLAYLLIRNQYFGGILSQVRNLSYFGAFFSGMMHAFSITLAPSVVIFYSIGTRFNPLALALIGAFGSTIGDYIIFRFVKNKLVEELRLLTDEISYKGKFYFQNSFFYKLFPFSNLLLSRRFENFMRKTQKSRTWKRIVKIMAFAIIASPLPNEIGITMLGATKQKTKEFVILSFLLSFLGIFVICFLGFKQVLSV